MTRVLLHHRTEYQYSRPVVLNQQLVRLRPAPHWRNRVWRYSLQTDPPAEVLWHQDATGTHQARLLFSADTCRRLCIDIDLDVDLTPINPFAFILENGAEQIPFRYSAALRRTLLAYLKPPPLGSRLQALVGQTRRLNGKATVPFLREALELLGRKVAYRRHDQPGVRDCEDTLRRRSGSCRDSAWLAVALLRHLGIAARFVSGYLVQGDELELHAWVEVYLPGAGWIGMDQTSGLFAAEMHIPLACAAEAADAAPLSGNIGWNDGPRPRCRLQTTMAVAPAPLSEPPPDTYAPPQWAAIQALGHQVDEALRRQDVRLTMGGEPTFVGADDPAHPQWQTAALGEEKRRLAEVLIHALRRRFASGGLVTLGEGKWYPGEPLPRWIFRCWWRTDGEPLWQQPQALAEAPVGSLDAGKMARSLARQLDVNPRWVLAAYEPDAGERPAGFILPLSFSDGAWRSARWPWPWLRVPLLAGDSPLGLRIPLSDLPPSMEVRTALCVQVREGRQHVFLPPLDSEGEWLRLVSAVEEVSARLGTQVVVEGYPPPPGHLLRMLSVTPDPGVIEVNVHPAASWHELGEIVAAVHEEAANSRLRAEKFWYDGRRIGTGGGNHITLGGPSVPDSPLLRRPDLLASLLVYFNHHPSLTYLFSGLFVGPTSQAPRVDEARYDALYELELALDQVSAGLAPEVVHGVFRNLLVDVSGNTHRSEFCVDKLYCADTREGCQGLLELRSFEMQPNPQLQMAVLLLVRGLVCMLWRTPFRQPLVRWGNQLHDRFMLPYFLWRDLEAVVADLRGAGLHFDPTWFLPHLEFRCPSLGQLTVDGLTLELRAALEPWPVLGEMVAGGTVRPVDSSMERMQISVSGLARPRFAVCCNGLEVPMHACGQEGEFVAGVRYRAWRFPASLHPTIPPSSSLRFDLVDTITHRSLAACSYRWDQRYESLPADASEAERRRERRFQIVSPSAEPVHARAVEPHAAFPMTLDLRRHLR